MVKRNRHQPILCLFPHGTQRFARLVDLAVNPPNPDSVDLLPFGAREADRANTAPENEGPRNAAR
eukprot:11183508-Lingulodinium_polyedra.AAC.1